MIHISISGNIFFLRKENDCLTLNAQDLQDIAAWVKEHQTELDTHFEQSSDKEEKS